MNESEYIFHQDYTDDATNKARHIDNEQTWVVESYDARTTRRMIELGATAISGQADGHLFRVDAKQLIEFVAATSGLIVEFRTRRRQQLSPEQIEARRQRMAEVRAKQFTNA